MTAKTYRHDHQALTYRLTLTAYGSKSLKN